MIKRKILSYQEQENIIMESKISKVVMNMNLSKFKSTFFHSTLLKK